MLASDLADAGEIEEMPTERQRAEAEPGVRGDLAGAVAAALFSGILTASERRSAVQLLEILARDVDRQVRDAVATHLHNCGALPAPLARELASELDTVALPVIQYARFLADPDLINIVRRGGTAQQMAVARRKRVSEPVSSELVDTGKADVVGTLLANEGASISAPSFMKALDTFQANDEIHSLMIGRDALPMTVVHALAARISDELRERLITRHQLPRDLAARLVFLGQERAIARTIATATDRSMMHHAVSRLHKLKALTPTLLLRLLLQGDLLLFEEAMVALAGVSRRKLRELLDAADWKGFQEIYRSAGLPSSLFAAVRIAVDVGRRAGNPRSAAGQGELFPAILDRLVEAYADVCPADIEHVLTQLSRQPGAVSLLHSAASIDGLSNPLPGIAG